MLHVLSLLAQSTSYSSSYTAHSSTSDPASAAAVFAILAAVYIPILIIGIVGIIGMWKTFIKAGKPGWYAIVPVYNGMVLAEIAGRPSWWGLGFLISPLSLVVSIVFGMDIAKRFHRTETFGVVALGLFSFVGYCMIGFGKDVYDPTATPTSY
jgi:nitrate reductase NapE component